MTACCERYTAQPPVPSLQREPEDTKHLLINYDFTKEIYRLIWLWFGLRGIKSSRLPRQEPANWLELNAVRARVGNSRKVAGILLYCW
jgi:hypothetical protein